MGEFFISVSEWKRQISAERKRHIAENHSDLLPKYRDLIASTLADPDQVRSSNDSVAPDSLFTLVCCPADRLFVASVGFRFDAS
jgi:hypothetical protein